LRDNQAATIMGAPRRRDYHPDCRRLLILIDALQAGVIAWQSRMPKPARG
jgi:hypothetical protein